MKHYIAKRIIIRNNEEYRNALYVMEHDDKSDRDYTLKGKNMLVISSKIEELLNLLKIDYGVIQRLVVEVEDVEGEPRP